MACVLIGMSKLLEVVCPWNVNTFAGQIFAGMSKLLEVMCPWKVMACVFIECRNFWRSCVLGMTAMAVTFCSYTRICGSEDAV